MEKISTTWKSSKKPGKQRKYHYNLPQHLKGKLFHVHLSDELSKKYGKRAVRVKKGDKVKIMKGQYRSKSGVVEQVSTAKMKLYIAGVESQKKDGTKSKYPIAPANVMITELNVQDKKRQESLKRK